MIEFPSFLCCSQYTCTRYFGLFDAVTLPPIALSFYRDKPSPKFN